MKIGALARPRTGLVLPRAVNILIFMFMALETGGQEAHFDFAFDFAFNVANAGWGMDVGKDSCHQINLGFCGFFIEHMDSNIGLEISPFKGWFNINSASVMSFCNIGLHYNLANLWAEPERSGSNYVLVGPFATLNYMQLNNYNTFGFNSFQINVGLRSPVMADFSQSGEKGRGLPAGFQIFNIEAGYRFKSDHRHRFYFSINTDLTAIAYIAGLLSPKPKEIEDYMEKEKRKGKI
jgi:hypothetical protein